MNVERKRLQNPAWKKWGPYVTDRQWGTVREDYSAAGYAWDFITHDMARSKAYRWGEDGIAGICDDRQQFCFAIALWNKKDPIIKERYFGLTGSEGNHGEDVKEYYYYLDNTPTHSYMKMLYKYPQEAYPYSRLVSESRRRSRSEQEFELVETGIFNEDKYFDVFIEYAKNTEEDILARITVHNRGVDGAALNVLPTAWFRNTWSWTEDGYKPSLQKTGETGITIEHRDLGGLLLYFDGSPSLLFTDNDTNVSIDQHNGKSTYYKDGINNYLTKQQANVLNPDNKGTKAAANYDLFIQAGSKAVVKVRLAKTPHTAPFEQFDSIFEARKKDADDFYAGLQLDVLDADARLIQRQALAGMLWSKQFYFFDVRNWLNGDPGKTAPPASRKRGRNHDWMHLHNADIISMPDKWEYPWYAAWDLAFHCVPLAMVDPAFAKQQLSLLTKEWYMHPNGQLPAYEWNFSDVNPPVHAWATYFVYLADKNIYGKEDISFLKSVFHKLLINFTWWVNRKDQNGNNVFNGGFLGLDNIGVFDRGAPLPTGGQLEQADATAWMALYCQNMLTIALELAAHDPVYEEMAIKFTEHFFWIATAMYTEGEDTHGMWDSEDTFFYDLLCLPDGRTSRLKIRSMVGLLPLCAATVFDKHISERYPDLIKRVQDFLKQHPELKLNMTPPGKDGVRLLSIMDEAKLRAVLSIMLDENEFLSPYGIRSLSKFHEKNPYKLPVGSEEYRVDYWPAESHNSLFGGNSNWRGPVWMPINALLIRALFHCHQYYGDSFTIECPTGSGRFMNLYETGRELCRRLTSIFLQDTDGRRPVNGDVEKFQNDEYWRHNIPFYEYFHGDNGAGLGASHQTGWTGFVAMLIHLNAVHWKK